MTSEGVPSLLALEVACRASAQCGGAETTHSHESIGVCTHLAGGCGCGCGCGCGAEAAAKIIEGQDALVFSKPNVDELLFVLALASSRGAEKSSQESPFFSKRQCCTPHRFVRAVQR